MKHFCSSQYWLIYFKEDMDQLESPFGAGGGQREERSNELSPKRRVTEEPNSKVSKRLQSKRK